MSASPGLLKRVRRRFRWLRVPRALKRYTNPVVGRVPIPILGGVNRGMRWSLASAGSGYGTGRRAAAQMELIERLIRPGDVVWDLGAHHGYVTLAAARRVGDSGEVLAFEPSPTSRWFLERHVAWNGLRNVTIHLWAVSSFDGEAAFGGRSTSKQKRLGGGEEVVQVRTMRTLLEAGLTAPTFVKMDVEGAEREILADGLVALRPDTRMLVAVHSPEIREACLEALERVGFAWVESERMRRYVDSGDWRGDADLYAWGPGWERVREDGELLEESGF